MDRRRLNPDGTSHSGTGKALDPRAPACRDYLAEAELMCKSCNSETLISKIETMAKNPKYQWAMATMGGIRIFAKQNGHVTDRQREAIYNIENAGKRRSR